MFPWNSVVLAAATCVVAHTASSCDLKHVLHYQMQDGEAIILLNDVFYRKLAGPDESILNFVAWTVEGENKLVVTFSGDQRAEFQIRSACAGDLDSATTSSMHDLSGGGKAELSFTFAGQSDPLLAAAEPADTDGLEVAYQAFRNSVLARDDDAVLGQMGVLIDRTAEQGWDRANFTDHLRHAVREGTFEMPENSAFIPAANRRVYQRLTNGFEAALISSYMFEESQWTMPLGTYWAKIDGAWTIIHN